MSDSASTDETQFGPYRIIRRVGEGAMGEVLLAIEPESEQQIALKRPWAALEADKSTVKRFEREAKAASSVNNPNVCRVFKFGRVDGRHFIAMEFVDGVSLDVWHRQNSQVSPRRILGIVRKVALGLHAIHQTGVIHRDMKPANIMIQPDDEPVITDFGIANLTDSAVGVSRLTPAGAMVGTPAYMSPEQNRYCPASDLYSLGVILYELLCGTPPFSGSLATILGTIVAERPVDLQVHMPELDEGLNALCQKALEKEPGQRFVSGQEFAAAIDSWLDVAPNAEAQATHSAHTGRIARFIGSVFRPNG